MAIVAYFITGWVQPNPALAVELFGPAPVALPVGNSPSAMTAGEFNGDGVQDLAVANADSDTVTVLLGDGLGGLARAADLPVGLSPSSVVVGEFNGDGDQDLALANTGSDTVTVLLGDGLGGFARTVDVPVGLSPSSVVVGEFNGDTAQDLAVANDLSHTVTVLLGDGLGGFARAADIAVGLSPVSVVVGEFNGDGAQDLAAASDIGGTVTVLLGNGFGGFSRTVDLAVGDGPRSIAVGEFNGDGFRDLAVANFFSDSVTLLFNQISARTDLNGSNWIDGFDVAAVGRRFGCAAGHACYRLNEDINLDSLIDGDDLGLLASRFGDTVRTVPPFQPALGPSIPPPLEDTVSFQPASSEADLLKVKIAVHDLDDAVAGADFGVSFDPKILRFEGFEPGSYLGAPGTLQIFNVKDATPGQVTVGIDRFPSGSTMGSGPEDLMSLFLRALKVGSSPLEFIPFNRGSPALVDLSGFEVSGVSFAQGVEVLVDPAPGAPPGRLSAAPDPLSFGPVRSGATARRILRLSNFGFSDLEILDVTSMNEFGTYFTEPFSIPPLSFVELTIVFKPAGLGPFSGEIAIDIDVPPPAGSRVIVHVTGEGVP